MNKLILIAAVLLISTQAIAREHTGFGDTTTAAFLSNYLAYADNKEAVEVEIDRWIDGWMDGMASTFAYEQILKGQQVTELVKCTRLYTPSQLRVELLQAGTDPDLSTLTTSQYLYWKVRLSCEHVLGKVEYSDEGESS